MIASQYRNCGYAKDFCRKYDKYIPIYLSASLNWNKLDKETLKSCGKAHLNSRICSEIYFTSLQIKQQHEKHI